MADDFYSYDADGEEPKGRDNLFLWTVFILLLIGIAFACWLGSFYIFGHPEKPVAYRFLKKIGKIEPPRRFEVTAAPQGEFLTAKKLFERYGTMAPRELEQENAFLLRDYIKNYRETKRLVTYVTGRFLILDAYDLRKVDIFPSGVVAQAQAVEFPQVVIEHVYCAWPRHVPALRALLRTGLEMKIEKTNDLSALLHVERLPEGHMQFTVVPLLYGTYALKQGVGTFNLEPPAELNIETGLPVIKQTTFDAGLKKFADYRRTHPIASTETPADSATPPHVPELVRVDTVEPGGFVPATGPLRPVPVATPLPLASRITPRPPLSTPAATPPLMVALLTPPPRAAPLSRVVTPSPRVAATPAARETPPIGGVSPSGVPLKPFIAAERDPNMPTGSGSWRIYEAGKAPPGRVLTAGEAVELADRGEPTERIYLRGEFRVTASGQNRAIMRERAAGSDAADTPRIIVDYPAGAVPPGENATFVRDAARPLLIRTVQRTGNGQLNIYAVEIMQ